MVRRTLNWGGILLLGMTLTTGCGRGPEPETASVDEAELDAAEVDDDEPAMAEGGSTPARKRGRHKPLKKKGPHIGGIPLDAFADRPVVTVATPMAPPPATAQPASETPMTAAPAEPPPAAGGGWEMLITADDIQAEVKSIRLQMKESLGSVSKYNGVYRTVIARSMSVLSGLAEIVAEQPLTLSWKPNAKYIRDMAGEVQAKASGLGNEPYAATQAAWEELDAFLDGNKPAKLPESPETLPLPTVVKRSSAMQRMEEAVNELKSSFGSAEAIKKDPEKAAHLAAVLATFSKIIGMDGYDSADDDEYKAFVQALMKSNAELQAAVKTADFTAFSDSLSRVNKTCNECHSAGFKP